MGFTDHLARGDRAVRDRLGQTILYAPGEGEAVTAIGLFDELFEDIEAGRFGVMSSGPAVTLTLADLPSDPEVDRAARVTYQGITYKARSVQKDGMGLVRLLLHEV